MGDVKVVTEKQRNGEQYSFACTCNGGSFKNGIAEKWMVSRLWHSWFEYHNKPGCDPRRLR